MGGYVVLLQLHLQLQLQVVVPMVLRNPQPAGPERGRGGIDCRAAHSREWMWWTAMLEGQQTRHENLGRYEMEANGENLFPCRCFSCFLVLRLLQHLILFSSFLICHFWRRLLLLANSSIHPSNPSIVVYLSMQAAAAAAAVMEVSFVLCM